MCLWIKLNTKDSWFHEERGNQILSAKETMEEKPVHCTSCCVFLPAGGLWIRYYVIRWQNRFSDLLTG